MPSHNRVSSAWGGDGWSRWHGQCCSHKCHKYKIKCNVVMLQCTVCCTQCWVCGYLPITSCLFWLASVAHRGGAGRQRGLGRRVRSGRYSWSWGPTPTLLPSFTQLYIIHSVLPTGYTIAHLQATSCYTLVFDFSIMLACISSGRAKGNNTSNCWVADLSRAAPSNRRGVSCIII